MKLSIRMSIGAAIIAGMSSAPALRAQCPGRGGSGTQTAAGTAQLTLSVPVQFDNFDPAVAIIINCCAVNASDQQRAPARRADTLMLANGAYKGTFDVKLSLSVAQPGETWAYSCDYVPYHTKLRTIGSNQAWAMPKAGTTPVRPASGTVVVQ